MRRKKFIAEEHLSQDRWLVSYADFITLLFAFFVVLFASAYRDKQAIIRVSNAVHNGFQALGAFPGGSAKNAIAYSGLPVESPEAPPPGMNRHDGAGPRPGIPAPDLEQLRRELQAVMGNELKNHEVAMNVTPEGFVISLKELGFFNSGRAELLPGAAEKIVRIARILSKHSLELRVEGHSDNQPIHNAQFRSNWELSTARAMSVLLILVNDAGYDSQKVSVAGYGQYRPIADDSTPEGRRMNRRVDLVVIGAAPWRAAGQ